MRARMAGLLLVALAVLTSSSVVGVSDAAGQTADDPATTTAAPVAPDPSATPPTPDGTTPLIDETPAPPEPPVPDPSPRIRVSLARLAVLSAQGTLAVQQASADRAQEDQAQAQASSDQAVSAQAAAERRLRTAQVQLGSTAVFAYMHAPDGDVVAGLRGDSTAGGKERRLFAAAVDRQQQEVADAEDALGVARANLDAARQALDRAQAVAVEQDRQVASASATLTIAQTELSTATSQQASPTALAPWQLSIEGPTVFTTDELTQWYDAQAHGSRASVPIAEVVRSFIDHGTAEGVRGDMAFAQSVHETGWFANLDTIFANNFAGIGHCDTCPAGIPFATADIGVLAQIQLLKSYADTNPTYNRPRAAPTLNGPSGCCQSWTKLGGVWASNPNYGPQILTIYDGMLEWLVARRSTAT